MKKPNFFIIGAPKCGTTTLASWLSSHPQVFFSAEKEPHHFYSPYGREMTRDEYESLFNNVREEHIAIGEASVWYLFSKTAIDRILDYSPSAKIIVCLRNPSDMAVSLHAQTLYIGRELLSSFDDAWDVSKDREAGSFRGIFGFNDGVPKCMAYEAACMLGDQVEALLSKIKRERIYFMLLDDLKKDPKKVWCEVQDFLALESRDNISYEVKNRAKKRKYLFLQQFTLFVQNIKRNLGFKRRFGLLAFFNSRNIVEEPYKRPSDETLIKMEKAFKKDILKLSSLIDRDLSGWIK